MRTETPVAGKPIAFVTGASRGIGEAVARSLLSTHQVYATARDATRLAALADGDGDCQIFNADLTDFEGFRQYAPRIDSLDVLVHAAGMAVEGPFDELPLSSWLDTYSVNVVAAVNITQHYLPALRRASGIVVFINSGSGLFTYARGSAYAASKFALRAVADCLREDERATNVRVTSIHPGFVDTEMGMRILREQGLAPDRRALLGTEVVAQMVRTAVDAPQEAQVESLSVRPSRLVSSETSVP